MITGVFVPLATPSHAGHRKPTFPSLLLYTATMFGEEPEFSASGW